MASNCPQLARAVLKRREADESRVLATMIGWLAPFLLLMAWRLGAKLSLAGNQYLTRIEPLPRAEYAIEAIAASLSTTAPES